MVKNNRTEDDINNEEDKEMNETIETTGMENGNTNDILGERASLQVKRAETRQDRYERYDRNSSYCKDPTVAAAMRDMEADDRFHKLLKTIFYIVNLAGFDLCGRLTVVDRRTGKVFN